MFNFPMAEPRPLATVKIEQVCVKCGCWFKLPQQVNELLHEQWVKRYESVTKQGARSWWNPFTMCTCEHCGKEQIAISIGKYDHPLAAKHRCQVQYVGGYI